MPPLETLKAASPAPAALDRALPVPLYHQLKSLLLARIESGELKPHDRLETEDELAGRYRVSKATVRQALAELAREGEVRREQGRGTFVAEPRVEQGPRELTSFSDDMKRRGLRGHSKVLERTVVKADEAIARFLGLKAGAPVLRLQRLRLADGEPLGIQTAYVPLALAPGLEHEQFETGSLYEILERKYGLTAASARESHFAALLPRPQCRLLKAPAGSVGLCAERTAFLPDGKPLEHTSSAMRADRYQITLELVKSGGAHGVRRNEESPETPVVEPARAPRADRRKR
jgi:GntR family transcriptional regulator